MATIVLERGRRALLDDLRLDRDITKHVATLILSTIAFGAIYGAVLGSWHGARLAAYVAIKVPLLMLSTAVITALFNWIVAALLGLRMRIAQTFALTLVPLVIASIVAASLAPVAWFFTQALPGPSPAQRTLHNVLYLVHVALIAMGGIAGTRTLRSVLVGVCDGDEKRARAVRFAWVVVYAFVGGEMAWVLRPFVGSVFLPVVFLRDDALKGNVYEFILTDILPHLWRSL
ncbi:MAG TPA: hypothetical protein VGQ36_14315 [Thermoanaerobaculia bacterium]|jgi:hypothetical protein|nr:hypothetical protein [Thermoanaerobaculia bacterium]